MEFRVLLSSYGHPSHLGGAVLKIISIFSLIVANSLAESARRPDEVVIWPESSKILSTVKTNLTPTKKQAHHNITNPVFLIYPPKISSTRIGVIVFPGGGYKYLAIGKKSTIGKDGSDVCRWLNESGITCFLLKYRVPHSGCYWDEKTRKHVTPDIPIALQDAQRTLSIIRHNAKKYDLDPNKIGVMGFSAGGNLAVLSSTRFKKRSYDNIDEIDQISSRPDFVIPVYPGHMTMEHRNKIPKKAASQELNTDILISKEIPPTLLVHAQDDLIDPIHYSEVYEHELKKAGVKVKLNIYKTGGHAFGVRKTGKDSDRWMQDTLIWLKDIKML